MFSHHRKSPWFAEKYSPAPEFVALRARIRRIGWRGRLDTFLMDLETGKFDPDFNEPDPEGSSSVMESNTNGDSAMNGAETSTIAADEELKPNGNGDDEMQFNVEVEDENGDQDAGRIDSNGRAGSSFLYFSQRVLIPLRGFEPSPASCSAALSALSSSWACCG